MSVRFVMVYSSKSNGTQKAFDKAKGTKRYAIFDAPILLYPKL